MSVLKFEMAEDVEPGSSISLVALEGVSFDVSSNLLII